MRSRYLRPSLRLPRSVHCELLSATVWLGAGHVVRGSINSQIPPHSCMRIPAPSWGEALVHVHSPVRMQRGLRMSYVLNDMCAHRKLAPHQSSTPALLASITQSSMASFAYSPSSRPRTAPKNAGIPCSRVYCKVPMPALQNTSQAFILLPMF